MAQGVRFQELREGSIWGLAGATSQSKQFSSWEFLKWLPAIPLVVVLIFGSGSVALVQASPAPSDTRSQISADYQPWEFTVIKPVAEEIIEEIQKDQELYPEVFDEPVEPEVAPGSFWDPTAAPSPDAPTPTPTIPPTAALSPTPTVLTPTPTATVSPTPSTTPTSTPFGPPSPIPPGVPPTNTYWFSADTAPFSHMMYTTLASASDQSGGSATFHSPPFAAGQVLEVGTTTVSFYAWNPAPIAAVFSAELRAGDALLGAGSFALPASTFDAFFFSASFSTGSHSFADGERLEVSLSFAAPAEMYWDSAFNYSGVSIPSVATTPTPTASATNTVSPTPSSTSTATNTPTSTTVPPTNTSIPPTNTPVPPTSTPIPPTNTPSSRYYRAQLLTEFTTSNEVTYQDTGAALTFMPSDASEQWVVVATWRQRETVNPGVEVDLGEARVRVNGVVRTGNDDITYRQSGDAFISSGTMFKITGTTAAQTIDIQFRAEGGTQLDGIDDIRLLAFMIPDPSNADIQYTEQLTPVTDTVNPTTALTHTFSPTSAGDYIWMVNGFHHEGVGGGTTGGLFVRDETSTVQQESDESYIDLGDGYVQIMHFEERTLTTGSKTFTITHQPDTTQGAERRGLSMLTFRSDVFEGVESADDATETTNGTGTPATKVSLTTATQASARYYIYLAVMMHDDSGGTLALPSNADIRLAGSPVMSVTMQTDRSGYDTNINWPLLSTQPGIKRSLSVSGGGAA